MVPIFIVSNRNYTGKTFFALGLALELIGKGYKVGYIKPLGKTPVKIGRELYDADSIFIKEALSLPDPLSIISPFVLSYENQNLLYQGSLHDTKKHVLDAIQSQADKDFTIIGGGGDFFEGSSVGIDAMGLIEDINAKALMVEAWRGDISSDTLFGAHKLLGKRFAGGIINKVPANTMNHVKETVLPFLKKNGVNILGVFQKDSVMASFTIRQLIEGLNGTVHCCVEMLDEPVEHFSIGAMDVDSALRHFRRLPNKAVITGAHRADIQLAALETSTKCIILTGGLNTNEVVLGKAQAKGVPIISVIEDTFTTVDRIEALMGKTRIREKGKIERARELIAAGFDMEGFLKAVGSK